MITDFKNREEELKTLNQEYKKTTFSFYPIYGRRRIGKTELIKQFIKNKPHIYYLATEGTEKENITNFKKAAENIINLSMIKDDFEEIFKYVKNTLKKRTIIVIDEFPFLTKANKAISSKFQRIIDLHLKKSNIFLILCGSSVSMMYKNILGYKAPLYGRRTGQIELKPFTFKNIKKILNKPTEECIKIYGICGGIPFYLKEFTEKKDIYKLINEKIFSNTSILNKEVIFLLREEIDEISRYASITTAVALGYTKLGEIMNYCGLKEKLNIAPYLNVLERIGIIEKETPITSKKRAKGIYKIKDQFFRFYFHYIRPNESIIENDKQTALKILKKDYNSFLGNVFERISKEFIIAKHKPTKIGSWWHKDKEIDIVAINEIKKQIIFLECKWKKINYNQTLKIIKDLKEKAKHVKWLNKSRKEKYGVIAKTIEKKNELRKKGFHVYDLNDWK